MEQNPHRRSGPALRRVRALQDTLPTPARTRVLIDSLSDPSLSVRRAAELRLSVQRDPAGLEGLAEVLRRGSDPARDRALRVLEQWAHPPDDAVGQALAPVARIALSDALFWNRRRAVNLLGALGQAEDTALLRACLNDPSAALRVAAVEALAKIGDVEGWEALLPLLEDPDTLDVAARALTNLGERRAAPALLDCWIAAPGSPSVADALGRLGDRQAIAALLLELDDPRCADEVALALLRLGERRIWPQVRERFESSRWPSAKLIEAVLRHAEPEDLAWIFDAPGVQSNIAVFSRRIIELLEALGPRHLRALEQGLLHPEHSVRRCVAEALGAYRCEEAGEQGSSALRAALADPDHLVVYAAVRALGRRADTAAVPELIAGIEARSLFVATFAEVLAQVSAPEVVPALIRSLTHYQGDQRSSLIKTLAALGGEDADAKATYLELLRDPNWWVRHQAIEALARTPDKRSFRALRKLLEKGEMHDVPAVLRVLGCFAQPGIVELLTRGLRSSKEWVRASALMGLQQLGDHRAEGAIRAAMEHEDPSTRDAAVWAALTCGLEPAAWVPSVAEHFARQRYGVLGDRLSLLIRWLDELETWPEGLDPTRLRNETILLRQRVRARRLLAHRVGGNLEAERSLGRFLDLLEAKSPRGHSTVQTPTIHSAD